jgi:UDP-N-acetylmuramoyl-L-alanyl-D-glutamate--2,6-diaminopimelate ligase
MKALLKKIIPKQLLALYYLFLAKIGSFLYGYPSRKMIVIGVTGTKGKSTTVYLIAQILEKAGKVVGLTSTIGFKIGRKEWVNDTKQTMQGRWRLQKLLSQMVKAGCQYAIIETSSEGIAQYRHVGIDYDVVVFTNLSPEHIESHGSYEKYRAAKMKLFKSLYGSFHKKLDRQLVRKVVVVNADDPEACLFFDCRADEKWGVSLKSKYLAADPALQLVVASDVVAREQGVTFKVNTEVVQLKLLGTFNVYNALLAMAVGQSLGIELSVIKKALEQMSGLPGRLEEISNDKGFRIFVDYAHEPASLEAVYQTIKRFRPRKMIAVLGSTGGGRDKAKRPTLGKLADEYADEIIVTNEDPYDEDPQTIINEVAGGIKNHVAEKVLARKDGIQRALSLAQAGDIVIITGKGSETVMAVAGGQKGPWDDRAGGRELLTAA